MAIEWRIKALHLSNCNCAYGCPCKFTALPTRGDCRSVVGYEIEDGYFGAIRLDGLQAALIWSVFSLMCPNRLDPLSLPIEAAIDVEARRGHFRVSGFIDTVGEPIRKPVNGAEHRARIQMPEGAEFRVAEAGSGTTRTECGRNWAWLFSRSGNGICPVRS